MRFMDFDSDGRSSGHAMESAFLPARFEFINHDLLNRIRVPDEVILAALLDLITNDTLVTITAGLLFYVITMISEMESS